MVVAMLVLSTATQLGAAVVCVGFNGHIDLESILTGCCISGISGGQNRNAALVAGASTCGDCTDLQLDAPPLRLKESALHHPVLDADCTACSPGCGAVRAVGNADAFHDMDQHSQYLSALSTVILLT